MSMAMCVVSFFLFLGRDLPAGKPLVVERYAWRFHRRHKRCQQLCFLEFASKRNRLDIRRSGLKTNLRSSHLRSIRLSWFSPGGRASTRLRGATELERDILGLHLSTTPSSSWDRRLLIARCGSLSLGTRSNELHRLSYYLELRTLSSSLFVIPLVQMEPPFHKEWVTFVEMLLHDLSGPTKSG